MSDIPKAVWSGKFRIFGVDVKCHTLDNGKRIIESESFGNLLEAMSSGKGGNLDGEAEIFFKWQKGIESTPKGEGKQK